VQRDEVPGVVTASITPAGRAAALVQLARGGVCGLLAQSLRALNRSLLHAQLRRDQTDLPRVDAAVGEITM
jgi:hypothetical protein